MNTNTSNAYRIYEANHVTTASPKRLLIMMYDGAIRFCRLAEMAIGERNIEKKNEHLKRAQAIIAEFLASLNFDAGETADQLSGLYTFMLRELAEANMRMDAKKVADVREILEGLRDAWAAIV